MKVAKGLIRQGEIFEELDSDAMCRALTDYGIDGQVVVGRFQFTDKPDLRHLHVVFDKNDLCELAMLLTKIAAASKLGR